MSRVLTVDVSIARRTSERSEDNPSEVTDDTSEGFDRSETNNNTESTHLASVRSEMRMPGSQRGNDYDFMIGNFLRNVTKLR
jgi:hypothetical protein